MIFPDQEHLDRDAQFSGEAEQAHSAQIEGRLKDLHTILPGIVDSWDGSNIVSVQPAIQRVFTEKGAANLPLCVDVPVVYPGSGGLWLTFPINPGDECLLAFSERAIDYWFENGGVQLPAFLCKHHLGDAIAIFGLNSKPKALANVATDGIALRTRDNSVFVKVGPTGVTILGDVTVTGKITTTGDVTANGISLETHVHGQVQSGGDNTGVPIG